MSGPVQKPVRSMPVAEWPAADRHAWEAASVPGFRLRRGGAASHLKPITGSDLARRYGYFLDHLQRTGNLDLTAAPAALVTPEHVETYLAELQGRVSSVTTYGSIYKLRRVAELIEPNREFDWLVEIEKALDLVKVARSKYPRLFTSTALLEIGLTLLEEAEILPEPPLYRSLRKEGRAAERRARGAAVRAELNRGVLARNGLLLAVLALCPIRLKNLASLEIGKQLRRVGDQWWIVLRPEETKTDRADERLIPEILIPYLDRYIAHHRPVLSRGCLDPGAGPIWVSSQTGGKSPYSGVERSIRSSTAAVLSIEVGPHMFRVAAATTSASLAPSTPGLGSAILDHTNERITEEHYNRARAHEAAQAHAEVLQNVVEAPS